MLISNLINLRNYVSFRYHWSSEIYGRGSTFRKFFFFPSFMPLLFTSDHGVAFDSFIDPDIVNNRRYFKLHITNNPIVVDVLPNKPFKFVFTLPTIHPWIRRKNKLKLAQSTNASGTLFFPSHYAGGVDVIGIDDQASISYLKKLDSSYSPITICFYYADMTGSRPSRFEAAGFEVLTIGDPFRSDYFEAFYKLIASKSFAITEDWTSAVFYCVDLGVPTQVLPRGIRVVDPVTRKDLVDDSDMYFNVVSPIANKLFGSLPTVVTAEQASFVRTYLGYDYTPNTRKAILLVQLWHWLMFIPWILFGLPIRIISALRRTNSAK